MQSQFTLIQNDQWWTIPLAWTIAPQSLNILNQRCTNTRTNDYSSRLHFFEYYCFHVSHNIVEYTRSEESRAPRCNKFLSYPIHLSRSHRVASHSLAHLSHNHSAAAVTNPSAAQADGLFVRSVCLISSLVPCSSTRNVTVPPPSLPPPPRHVSIAVDARPSNEITLIKRGCRRGKGGQVVTAPFVWGWGIIRQWHWIYRSEFTPPASIFDAIVATWHHEYPLSLISHSCRRDFCLYELQFT